MDSDLGLIVRNNTEYLAKMSKLTLFTRPTQMGKSTLLSLAEMVYSKTETAPTNVAKKIPKYQRNAGYVIRFDFLNDIFAKTHRSWQEDLRSIDSAFFKYIKECVADFLKLNEELKPHFTEPTAEDNAGDHLLELSTAVRTYSRVNKTTEFFMVLVDEYDKPLRETLFLLLEQSEVSAITKYCPLYISFFHCCKSVSQMLPENKIWVTGVVPIVLDLISDFKPDNLTFDSALLDVVGLRDEDVDRMLECVNAAEPFTSKDEMSIVRQAIRDHANLLQFLTGSPLYHTRMVNALMRNLLNPDVRKAWLQDLRRKPGSVTRERAPTAIYKLLQKSRVCREIAKDLVADKGIDGALNEDLNLPDVARADISKNNSLTLLVHLGIASVQAGEGEGEGEGGQRHTFRSTSRYFRSEYLNAMLGVALALLSYFTTVDDIYNQQALLQDFMETLPASGMTKMINWAKASSGNRILELQFQGFLVGELHDHFMADDV